jgi:methylaspartate mutase epsilon subunit
MKPGYRLLLGSIGDDSHSIGTSLLAIAFQEAGFFVKNIGIMNQVEDFFTHTRDFDAIMISCMNGHADLYLKDFPVQLHHFKRKNPKTGAAPLWYLGGHLSVRESPGAVVKKYRRMGFDFVSPKPIPCSLIKERLLTDFYHKKIKKKKFNPDSFANASWLSSTGIVDDQPMADEEFRSTRKEVLSSWPTGNDVWDADIKKNHSWPIKNLHQLIRQVQGNGSGPLIQPRTGVAHTSDEIEILTYLRKNGLDVSSIQLDAASRKNMYAKAREGVLRTEKGKTSFLNGYPVPVHGVKGVEEILQAIDTPFQIRAGSPDHRLVYEIDLAGGASSVEGGFICYLYPYDKNTSPVENLSYWKYIDKLVDWYDKTHHIIINREYFGPLTCCLVEPVIPICINIVQAVLSAKWGARCISVGLAEQGNRSQDIAALTVLNKMTRRYLTHYGFTNVTVSTVYHQYMAAFPHDIAKARELIVESSITAALAKANRIMTKTPVEFHHIPSKEDNAEGLRLTQQGLRMAADTFINRTAVHREMQLLEREVKAIMTTIESLGQGSLARGIMRAFAQGVLDIMFSPSNYNKNQLLTARDCDGAVRFINPGQLPFEQDIIDFHKEKIQQRMIKEKTSKVSEIIETDVTRIWKNDYLKWPLDGHYLY